MRGAQHGVVVAPLMRIALLHMAPPRPQCRGLDEKAGGAGVLAAAGAKVVAIGDPAEAVAAIAQKSQVVQSVLF